MLAATAICAFIGCSSSGSYSKSHPVVQDESEAPALVVWISESGAPRDENGEEISEKKLKAQLASGELTLDSLIWIRGAITGDQVLRAIEMFDSQGFRNVSIIVVTKDPIR